MKRCLLIGCGAEIGSNLLLLNDPDHDGFAITTVLTNAPPLDKHYPDLRPIDGIVARLALAQPGCLSQIAVKDGSTLVINGNTVNFIFCDLRKDLPDITDLFDIAFLCTNKADISLTSDVAAKIRPIARIILGAAESDSLPSLYTCLADLDVDSVETISKETIGDGMYCLGSCQTNGMHASLRVVIQALDRLDLTSRDILAIETDIVHPDTPNGVLGTRSFEGRMQDARDNLRPSFSQIAQSQRKVMPWAPLINTISLRAPVHAPGFQINRFIVKDHGQLRIADITSAIDAIANQFSYIARATTTPLGGRAYSQDRRCATILTDPCHLILHRPSYLSDNGLSQIILQSFVNNTIGYSAVVMAAARRIALQLPTATFKGFENG